MLIKNFRSTLKKNNKTLKKTYPHAKNFTIVDYLINCFELKTFHKVMKKTIEENLEYTYYGNTTNTTSTKDHLAFK
jgi:S-methylmethionine-dependent homocysteine/selenocysteine methylase